MTQIPITNKHEMYRRLNAGLLGHTLPAAETFREAEKMYHAHFTKLEHPFRSDIWVVRSKKSNSSCLFNVTFASAMNECVRLGEGNFNFSPMLDDTKRIIYAHYSDYFDGWHLHYTNDPKPARLLQSKDGCEQKWMNGVKARVYLRHIMDDIGWETLNRLQEEYPDHCIEFTVMASSLNAFGPTNTIFWEVRCLTGEYEQSTFGVKQ